MSVYRTVEAERPVYVCGGRLLHACRPPGLIYRWMVDIVPGQGWECGQCLKVWWWNGRAWYALTQR